MAEGRVLTLPPGAPVSDPAGIQKHPETRRIGDRRSEVLDRGSVKCAMAEDAAICAEVGADCPAFSWSPHRPRDAVTPDVVQFRQVPRQVATRGHELKSGAAGHPQLCL